MENNYYRPYLAISLVLISVAIGIYFLTLFGNLLNLPINNSGFYLFIILLFIVAISLLCWWKPK